MALPFDLMEPRFTQAEVLRLLPALKPKTLQNWSQRGVLGESEGKTGRGIRRLYTPLGVVMLNFMISISPFGVPPSEARDMADSVAEHALTFNERDFEIITREDGARWMPVSPDNFHQFKRAVIVPIMDGSYYLRPIVSVDSWDDRLRSNLGILIELDYEIVQVFNRIFLLEAGVI